MLSTRESGINHGQNSKSPPKIRKFRETFWRRERDSNQNQKIVPQIRKYYSELIEFMPKMWYTYNDKL